MTIYYYGSDSFPIMQYRLFGSTGIKVSELCLGTMTFGREADKDTSFKIMDRFVEEGGNFFDTANVYNQGVSEEIIGEWLSKVDREDIFIATKVRFPMGEGPNSGGLTRKHILKSLNDSLSRLGTDYVDLLQVHAWDPLTPIKETMKALHSVVEQGKARYIGASNFRGWQIAKSLEVSRLNGFHEFASIQPQYSLLCRATEYEILPLSRSENLAVLPWSPLKGGALSGKYARNKHISGDNNRVSENIKMGRKAPWESNEDYFWKVIEAVRKAAETTGKTPSQVALNWLLSNDAVTSPIIGARNLQQLNENINSTGWELDRDTLALLDEASRLYVTYPYDAASEEQQMAGRIP